MAKKKNTEDIEENINFLKHNINSVINSLDEPMENMFVPDNLLPNINNEYEEYDYEKDIELIKIESKETLESLANLYLDEDMMNKKNIYKIIKDDAELLSNMNFSISMAKRALISCMRELDKGITDPELYKSVSLFQKEMRDTIKQTYDLQKKMKDFYKELKEELKQINSGEDEIESELEDDEDVRIVDTKIMNDIFDEYKKNRTLLK